MNIFIQTLICTDEAWKAETVQYVDRVYIYIYIYIYPNYSTILFDLHDVVSEDNHSRANDLSYDSIDSFDSEGIPSPKLTSSPIKPRPTRQAKNRPLRIVNVNCQSINNKKDRFLNLTDSTKPDVIIATETWLHSEILSAEFFSTHYEVHRRDCPDKKGGGVLIAVNSEYANSRAEDLEPTSSESLWVKIDSPKSRYYKLIFSFDPTIIK